MIFLSKKNKLINRLKTVPSDFTFDEAETLVGSLGGKKSNKGKTSGSRVKFLIGDKKINLHKPHPGNVLRKCQVVDLIDELEKEGLI